MRHAINVFATIGAGLVLVGCVAVWGSPYHIEAENPSSVTIRYDAALTNLQNIQSHADESCGKYQKVAVPKSQRTGVVIPGGSIAEIVFVCNTPAAAGREYRAPLLEGTLTYSPPVEQQPAFTPQPLITLQKPPAPPEGVPPSDLGQFYAPAPHPPTAGGCIGVVHVPFRTAIPCPDSAPR